MWQNASLAKAQAFVQTAKGKTSAAHAALGMALVAFYAARTPVNA